jgi:hypothetical protein
MPEAQVSQLDSGAMPGDATRSPTHDVEQASGSQMADKKPADPYVVNWDGPADLANPRNWSKASKTIHIVLVSGFVLYA